MKITYFCCLKFEENFSGFHRMIRALYRESETNVSIQVSFINSSKIQFDSTKIKFVQIGSLDMTRTCHWENQGQHRQNSRTNYLPIAILIISCSQYQFTFGTSNVFSILSIIQDDPNAKYLICSYLMNTFFKSTRYYWRLAPVRFETIGTWDCLLFESLVGVLLDYNLPTFNLPTKRRRNYLFGNGKLRRH